MIHVMFDDAITSWRPAEMCKNAGRCRGWRGSDRYRKADEMRRLKLWVSLCLVSGVPLTAFALCSALAVVCSGFPDDAQPTTISLGQANETVHADDAEMLGAPLSEESERDSETFTLVVLPDTQGYADTRHKETQRHWPDIGDQRSCFFAQTEWIKKNKQKMNIVMVAHVGDITQTGHEEEWKIADAAFKTLDNHVPYIVCSGNHDMGYSSRHEKTSYSRESLFSSYFNPSRFTQNPLYDSHFGSNRKLHFREEGRIENYYLYLRAGGMKFLVLTLEFKPRDETLAWANEVVARHPDYRAIIITHGYLTRKKGQRTGVDSYSVKGNSGKKTWETFIRCHENIFLVLSGHALENLLTSKGKQGNTVHQVQADYWYWDIAEIKAGSGFLRIMTFHPDKNIIDVQTYSPVLDKFLTRPQSRFSLDYLMQEKGESDGTSLTVGP